MDIMQYIDQINQSVADAEIDVMESLIESYDKSIMILENCSDDTDFSAFDIFQEGDKLDKIKSGLDKAKAGFENVKSEADAPIIGKKGESVGKRFLMLIPRIINALIKLVKTIITKLKHRNAFKTLENLNDVTIEDVDAFNDYLEKNPKKKEKYLKKQSYVWSMKPVKEYAVQYDNDEVVVETAGNAKDWSARIGNVNPGFEKSKRHISVDEAREVDKVVKTAKKNDRFSELVRAIETKTISSRFDFDRFISFYEQMMYHFEKIDNKLKDAIPYIDKPPVGYKVKSDGNLEELDSKKLAADKRGETIQDILENIREMDNLKGRYNIKYGEKIPSAFVGGWHEKTAATWSDVDHKLREVINKETTAHWESIRKTLDSHPAFAEYPTLTRDLCQQFSFVHHVFQAFYEEYMRVTAIAEAASDLYSEYKIFRNMYGSQLESKK